MIDINSTLTAYKGALLAKELNNSVKSTLKFNL